MSQVQIPFQRVSRVQVVAATGAAVAGTTRGQVTPARTGAGVYTLTLGGGGIDTTEVDCHITPHTANIIAQVVKTSDTVLTVNTFLGSTGAATDSDFTAVIDQVLAD